jgi:hypothetical protein
MLTVFFNPEEFAIVDLLPQDISFTTVDFLSNVVLLLAHRHAQQLEDIGRRKLHLHFDNSKCHTAGHVGQQMASYRCVLVLHPPVHPTWPSQISTCLAESGSI